MLNSKESVHLMVDRLKSDFESMSSRMRKPFGIAQVEPLLDDVKTYSDDFRNPK